MLQSAQFKHRQRSKRNVLIAILLSAATVFLFAELRFVPSFNDKISGAPNYMRHIAVAVAEALNTKLTMPSPIFVAPDETRHCETVYGSETLYGVKGFDASRLFYVITYSENSYSYCLAVYGAATPAARRDTIVTLAPDTGDNYGGSLPEPAAVVPIGHSSETFALVYLSSLLHWRSDPQKYRKTAFPGGYVPATGVGLPGGDTINVNFLDLRPAVAKRHNLTNFALVNGIVLAIIFFLVSLLRLWGNYRAVSRECAACGQPVSGFEFLLQNPDHLVAEARERHQQRQRELQQAQERSRSESRTGMIFRQWQEELRAKLEAALKLPLSDADKQKIQACLGGNDLEQMKALAEELQDFHPQKSAEDRLRSLLETLKEYCDADEFIHYQQEALAALRDQGFREAREFIVKAHAELRFRARKSSAS